MYGGNLLINFFVSIYRTKKLGKGDSMKIVPTKKSLPLFSSFDLETACHEKTPTFFSWHANYFTFNRKKILVLVNTVSYSPIVLLDINAKNKKNLPSYIRKGISEIFSYSSIEDHHVKFYFDQSSSMEISKDYNRSLINITNKMIHMIKRAPEDLDFDSILQLQTMISLANIPYKSLSPSFSFSTEIVQKEFVRLLNNQ